MGNSSSTEHKEEQVERQEEVARQDDVEKIKQERAYYEQQLQGFFSSPSNTGCDGCK